MKIDMSFDHFFKTIVSKEPASDEGEANQNTLRGITAYKNNYIFGHCNQILKIYPSIVSYLGEANTNFFGREYLYQHPPNHANMDQFGSDFGVFLDQRDELTDHPLLLYLARLDWFSYDMLANSTVEVPQNLVKIWLALSNQQGGDIDAEVDLETFEKFIILEDKEGSLSIVNVCNT